MITITRGEDRNLNLYFVRSNKRPYDLTGWTNISLFFKNQDGTLLEKNTVLYDFPAYAEFNGVLFTAVTGGVNGNSIILNFNGVQTISDVIGAWNGAYPLNQVSSDDTNPTVTILPSGTVHLANGEDNVQDVRVVSEVLGSVTCNLSDSDTSLMMLGKALTFKATIDKGSPTMGERRNIMFHNQLEVIDDRF